MQLKWKKIGIISTVIMYFATFLMQSNIEFFKVWAGEANKPRVNIVAILVDDKIYKEISSDLNRYASSYVQQKLSDTKALILPLQLETVSAYDIHRMLENIYFDGLEDVNSSLIGLVMVGNIPLPVVNQDGYVFPTVYPYVDFENQKYVWNSEIKYFVPNGNKGGQAEIWHGLINYGSDSSAYTKFFAKIRKYVENPDEFIGDAMWYEDFIAEKEGFLNENYKYYRNKIMFAEDLGYQRYSPLMKSLFNTEYTENSTKILDDLKEVSDHADWMDFEIPVSSSDESHTTKLVQQEIDDSYLADYSELFSKVALTTRRENIFAGGRRIKTYENDEGKKSMEVDADSSMSMVQFKDTLYLGNDNLVGVIQNLNNILEKYVDDKIESEKYSMDLVIPVEYRQKLGKKIKVFGVALGCYPFVTDYKNYYFGKDARYVDNVNDLSIYRGTFRNLTGIDGLRYSDLTGGKNSVVSSFDKTDVTKKSIGASYDIFSNQVEGNRGYVMMSVQKDLSEYSKNKTRALDEEKTRCVSYFLCKVRRKSWPSKCDEDNCESVNEFAERWWGGASAINLDFDSLGESKYRLSGYKATDSWRPIFDMGGYQSLLSGKDEGSYGTGWIHGTGTGPQWDATNFKAYIKYSSPTEVAGWDKRRRGYRVYNNHMPNVHKIGFYNMSYWNLPSDRLNWNFQQESDKFFTIENKSGGLRCGSSEKYTYKFISSVVKHDSTKDEEINGIDRDLYGRTGRLGRYYDDVEFVYSGLYQDIQNILLSGDEFVTSLDEKGLELSGYILQLRGVLLGSHMESGSEILSGVEDILSGSREEFVGLYSSISSLIADNIVGTLESIIYTEGGDLESFYDQGDNSVFLSLVTVPFLPSWIVNVDSFVDSIISSKDSLLEIYDRAYFAMDSIKSQRADFYSGHESAILSSSFGERMAELNSGFENMFIWYLDDEEVEESELEPVVDVIDEMEDSETDDEDEIEYIELTTGSVIEPVESLINAFTGTSTGISMLFSKFFASDITGIRIIREAKNDKDFKDWCKKYSVDINGMTEADLITQYANWAKGDGYGSAGAKKNHELLLGVVEHMSGMNLLTPDRPIDSPRYVSMQSINGKEVKLIYPDLFKVEVFELTGKNKSGYDIHLLLTGGQIKENLVKYIKNKVDEYNALLNVSELPDNDYYRKIAEFDKYATPYKNQRPYKPFTYNEFVDAIGGEQMLDVIADILYYQNLTNKKKLSSSGVNEDISFIKQSFNINDKRESVLEDYLTEGNEEKKHPLLVIPKYELSGYEVAYVNSDGGDYVIPAETYSGVSLMENQGENVYVKYRKIENSPQEQEFNNKCNIPSNGKLPLFSLDGGTTWLDGFLCWWEETKKNPLKVSLTFDDSLGDVVGGNLKLISYLTGLGSNLVAPFTDWKDAMSDYADERNTLLGVKTGHDSENEVTQRQVEAENHNRIVLSGNDGISNALSNINRNVNISNSNPNLSENNPTSLLEISSIYDVQNINMTIEGTGDGCLKLNESEVCPGSKLSFAFNPKTNPFTGIVESANHKAGSFAFIIKLGLGGDNYIEKVIKYTISPGNLVSVEIKFGDKKTVAGMLTPVEVIGRDKDDNRVSWGLNKYDFRVSTGRFLREGSYSTGFTTNDFRNLNFYYQAPSNAQDGSEAVFEIVESSEFDKASRGTLGTYRQRLVQGALEVKLNDNIILQGQNTQVNQSYRLGDEDSIYKDGEIDVSLLQKLDLYIKDNSGNPIDLESQVIVKAQNGLVVLGQLQKNTEGQDVFFTTNKHNMSAGHVVVYYYPNKVSGDEVIKIEIPGLETRVINLSILPAQLANIQFRTSKDVLQLGDEMTGEVFFMDRWGNLIDSDGSFKFYYDEDKIEILGGKDGEVEKMYKDGYFDFKIIATGGGLSYIYADYPGAYISVMVDKHLFPKTGLNILYLNYFGDDRGNQRGYLSDNDNYIESVMSKSNKIITTTTQIASENKIKKMLWKIGPGFKIWNPGNQKTSMVFNGNRFVMLIGDVSVMESVLSFDWVTVASEVMNSILLDESNKSYAFFIPSDLNYKIDNNGILYNGDEKIGSIKNGDITLSLSDSFLDNGDNVWELRYKGTTYGEIVFHVPGFVAKVTNFERPSDRYLFSNTFSEGSTYNLDSVGLFDLQSDFELNTSYKSIQNSDELDEQVGFLGDFKNITLFAEGEIVGEATKKFGSEFVINLGDPLLSRKTKNENVYRTNYDGGIGQEIFADAENPIFGTYQIDFDGDGTKDLLVVYLDGTIKLAKNYLGNPDLRNLQDLMRIAVAIENVYIGDVNGDKLDDIIVQTENNQLRVYLNNNDSVPGEFDVDGNVACLNLNVGEGEKSRNPSDLSGVYNLYVEDMDNDKIMDIVTYDKKGYVKVFYGGTTHGGPNYLSKDKYSCDAGWYDRERGNTVLVTSFNLEIPVSCGLATSICNGIYNHCGFSKIYDNSMIHWDGVINKQLVIPHTYPLDMELPYYGIGFRDDEIVDKIQPNSTTDGSDSSLSGAMNLVFENTDIDALSRGGLENGAKYQDVSMYGSGVVTFIPISFLDPPLPRPITTYPDPVHVYKSYVEPPGVSGPLKQGDKIGVIVTIENLGHDTLRNVIFGDVIQGPWNLYYDENDVFMGIKVIGYDTGTKLRENRNEYLYKYYFEYNCGPKSGVRIMKKDGQFAYYLVKDTLAPGEVLHIGYELEYTDIKLKDMSLNYDEYWNKDEYPDIKFQSTDGCDKDFLAFVNEGVSRSFIAKNIPLQSEIEKSYAETMANTDDYSDDVSNLGSNVNALPGIVGDSINRIQLINAGELEISNDTAGKKTLKDKLNDVLLNKIKDGDLASRNLDFDVNLSVFENEVEKIENVVDDITKGMCEGFSFGGSNNCQGLPVPFNQAFFAPGKYHLFGCWEIPLGKLEDGLPVFFFPGTAYAGPIPFPMPNALKSPMDSFLWAPGVGEYPSMIRIYAAPTLTSQLGIAICMGPYETAKLSFPSPIGDVMGNCVVLAIKPNCKAKDQDNSDSDNPNETYSSVVESVMDTKTCTQATKGVQVTSWGKRSSPFNLYGKFGNSDSSFLGIIELETSSFVGPVNSDTKSSIMIGDVEILGGDYDVNKIEGGIQQGIRKLLIDKWLDPQIRYILNQLTKMHVTVKLPNLSNLAGYEMDVLKNVVKELGGDEDNSDEESDNGNVSDVSAPGSAGNKDLISRWKGISHETLNDFNQEIANPFDSLASLMNQSNIINISTEKLVVKVPFIMNEDIATYDVYLRQWLETNKKIVAERSGVINSLFGMCSDKTLKEAQEMCKGEASDKQQSCIETNHRTLNDKCLEKANEYRASLIEFEGVDWKKMENQIYANLLILQKYRNFPFEMYEWIHVIDRYIAEIVSVLANTWGYLLSWVSQNAERFVGYVDAIVLMMNIIKTYQLIINFSVEWSKNCGNCAKDTYDQYSCKLSILCDSIQLPIIQIPNFKLPNITIDLSNIDLGLDIVLPEFDFQTVRIELPQLPNLPHPPALGANIKLFDLPNIPQLPEPPHLPELPSFIPDVEIELPILPPAPEMPKLPNKVEALIKVADLIGKIYCIVKGDFGLVGEASVKAKIEQLTQRTYNVDWIDKIVDFTNLSAIPIKNYGVDYEITSYVDMQVNLSDFYSAMDSLTTWINNLTTTVVNYAQTAVNSGASAVLESEVPIVNMPISDIIDEIEDADIQINATAFSKNVGENSAIDFDGIKSDEIEYVDYSSAKNRLQEVLAYFREEGKNTSLSNRLNLAIDKIENQISTPNVIEPNVAGINKVKDQAIEYIESKKSEYSDLADMINNDYEGFLTMIDSENYLSGKTRFGLDSGKVLTYSVNLFNLDSSAEENLRNIQKENPYSILLDNKKDIIDGYWNAINKNSAADLGLTQSQYLVLRNDILKMKKQVASFYPVVKSSQSTKLVAKNGGDISDTTLLVSANAAKVRNPKGDEYEKFSVDPAGFAAGIYEKLFGGPDNGKLAKVVYSDSFVSSVGDNHYKTSRDDDHDIILWTEKAIYKKCLNQKCFVGGNHFRSIYVYNHSIKEIPYEETWIRFDSSTKLKIADGNQEVKNWKVKGQTYDSFTLSWKIEDVDAYLIKLVTRIDTSYEKSDRESKRVSYVLAIPEGLEIDENNKLELVNTKKYPIKDLLESNQLVEIVNYDRNKSVVSVMITGPEKRKWYYANIATLKFDDEKKVYNVNSPWSNQVVAGKQIVGDDQEPYSELSSELLSQPYLFRNITRKVVSEGDDLDGYVGTNYTLNIPWKDNVALSYINVSKDGEILEEKYTNKPEDSLSVGGLFRTKSGIETYQSVGIDQFGNKAEKTITVHYLIPDITITDIQKNQDGETVSIIAELSQDIDTGNVSFQRKRGEAWKTMKMKDSEDGDFALKPNQTIIKGSPYSMGNSIALYDSNDSVIALINPDTAEITLQDGYKDVYEIKVLVEDSAIIKFYNKNSKKYVFSLSLPIEEFIDIKANGYTVVDLPEAGNMGMYNGGKAVYKDGIIVLLISPTGHLYSDFSLEGTYKYDNGLKAIRLELYNPADINHRSPIIVWVKVKPFET